MFMMRFQSNIFFNGYNPFMFGCFNPRMNFFLGLAAGSAGVPAYPAVPSFVYPSVFTPFAGYSNPYLTSGFGTFKYQPQTFQYSSQGDSGNPFSTTPATPAVSTPISAKAQNDNLSGIPSYEVGSYTPACSSVKSKAFLNKVKEIARRLNCNYKDLLGVMNSESSLNPQAVNKSSGATGLIQFLPSTAKALGTSTEALKKMSAVAQLDYVEKYLQQAKRNAGFGQMEPISGGQLYALIFLPARANREVLTQKGEKYYSWKDKYGKIHGNFGLDTNKDGKITKSELDARIKKLYVNENCFVA